MILGRVKGNIISTRKDETLVGYKFLLIEPYYGDKSNIFVAADLIGAGEGELVLITTDDTTQYALDKNAPIDALVVGIVDSPPSYSKGD